MAWQRGVLLTFLVAASAVPMTESDVTPMTRAAAMVRNLRIVILLDRVPLPVWQQHNASLTATGTVLPPPNQGG
jgi:hypothetical protein